MIRPAQHVLLGQGRAGEPEPADPNFNNVTSLLHFDGPDGSTTFTDVKGVSWVSPVDASVSSEKPKFGAGSLKLTNSLDSKIETATSLLVDQFAPFTIEGWVYITGTSQEFGHIVFSQANNSGDGEQVLTVREDGTLRYYRGQFAGRIDVMSGVGIISKNQWHHVAATFDGTAIRIFSDGFKRGEALDDRGWVNTGLPCYVGHSEVPGYLSYRSSLVGFMDDFRVTAGVARYINDFTPPASPFPDSAA